MPLSDEQVQETMIPEGKIQLKISDGGGLYLLVKPSGRYWKLAYRFDGKQKSLALGVYPAVSLENAREKRGNARNLLAMNIDPGLVKQQEKREKRALTEPVSDTAPVMHDDDVGQLDTEPEMKSHQQSIDFSLIEHMDQTSLEDRRLRILQILAGASAYMSNEQVLQHALDSLGHKVSLDRLRTDMAWLYEQQLIHIETDALWIVRLSRHGLDMVNGRKWIPGIKRPEPA